MESTRINRVYSPIEEKMVGSLQRLGVQLEREFPIGPYFADIYIPSDGIVVECDGEAFHQNKERDHRRDKFMVEKGLRVFRFSGSAIMRNSLKLACNVVCHMAGSYPQHEQYLKQEEDRNEAISQYNLDVLEGRIDPPEFEY